MHRGRLEIRAGPARRERKRRDRRDDRWRARVTAILAYRRQQPLTARLLGDPLPGRSALDRRAEGPDERSAGVSVRIPPAEWDPLTTDAWPDEPDDQEEPGF